MRDHRGNPVPAPNFTKQQLMKMLVEQGGAVDKLQTTGRPIGR